MAFLVPHDTNPGVLAKGLVRPSPGISSRPGVTAAADMSVLGCRTLRRTVQVRLGSNLLRLPGGTLLSTVSGRPFMKHPG
jgi:hypothetical protein